jgi:hypothetical protein
MIKMRGLKALFFFDSSEFTRQEANKLSRLSFTDLLAMEFYIRFYSLSAQLTITASLEYIIFTSSRYYTGQFGVPKFASTKFATHIPAVTPAIGGFSQSLPAKGAVWLSTCRD